MLKTEISHDDLALFRKNLESYYPIPDEDFNNLAGTLERVLIRKGEIVLRPGIVCRDFYFIEKGCCRLFAIEDGKEINIKFFLEGHIAGDFKSLHGDIPSELFLSAMENTIALKSAKKEYFPIINESDSLSRARSKLIETWYIMELEQNQQFKLFGPEERYQFLIDNYPELVQRIPLIHLSSYLGVSRETLSRIRSRQG